MSRIEKLMEKVCNAISDRPKINIDTISSGSLLDNALGIGGYPRGRIIEILALSQVGKLL